MAEQFGGDLVDALVSTLGAEDDGHEQLEYAAELEFGDVLFALVNVARKEGIDAETALRRSCDKFRERWVAMEDEAYRSGENIAEVGTERLEELWNRAKERLSE